ncbi:Riboflavin synthase alpha chain [Triticum urartu]|uniref:Riboflavin synthase n=1 Tax=Triticum urartu TaxID=4572 RepID=M7ZKQ8_TRIUA|nr:riboflavin synthase [Triticum urartu]EMS60216.1 Riboflavin synthase alpha chain [Triticum urartu]
MAPLPTAAAAVRCHPHILRRGLLPASSPLLPFASRMASSTPLRAQPLRFSLSPVPKSISSSSASHIPVRYLFTGIVEEVGRVRRIGPPPTPTGGGGGSGGDAPGVDLEVETKNLLAGTQLGDSIAVDGTCLTVAAIDTAASTLTFGVAPETLRCTSLGERVAGDDVNLERALTPASRMGGHFVQGHVDGTGEIAAFRPEGDSIWVTVRAPPEILSLLVPKGFVAVDGTSLTVVNVNEEEGWFDFMLVRYTQDNVVLPRKKVGDKVNLEADILGKYVVKLLAGRLEATSKANS